MRALKIFAIAAVTLLFAASASASAMPEPQSNIISALTGSNGTSAGQALLGLYTQFKADGKLDLKNASNITNLLALATNIKALKGQGTATTVKAAAGGLLSKLTSKSTGSAASTSSDMLSAASTLTSLFGALKK